MPSREFLAIPIDEYPPYAARFQRSCIHWQQLRGIALPTRAYLAHVFGMPNANLFTMVFDGKTIPPPAMILSIARECEESLEEHLIAANIALSKMERPPYDSFTDLLRAAEYRREPEYRRIADCLRATLEPSWVENTTPWRAIAEEMLVNKMPRDQKMRVIAQMVEAATEDAATKQGDMGPPALCMSLAAIR